MLVFQYLNSFYILGSRNRELVHKRKDGTLFDVMGIFKVHHYFT